MSESKTARASAVKVVKEKHVETTEEAIKAIRENLAGGLHIGDMSRVRKLLAAYDEIDQTATKAESDLAIAQADLDRARHNLITANGRIVELETAASEKHADTYVATTFVGEE